ncbi:MAG: GtrA family protein [Pseudomonadota bacterium]
MKSLVTEERRALIGQLVRYALTGGLASIVNIGVYQIAATRFAIDPNIAWTMGFIAAVLVGYITHSRWSFRGHGTRDNLARTGSRFVAVSLISFGLNSFWVWLLVQFFALPLWSPYPLVLGITPLIVFTLNRKWVFG